MDLQFFVKPISPPVKWKPVLGSKGLPQCYASGLFHSCHLNIFYMLKMLWYWRQILFTSPVIMSTAEQKELKEKIYSFHFYKHWFQSFFFFFFSKLQFCYMALTEGHKDSSNLETSLNNLNKGQLIVLTLKYYWGKAVKFLKETVSWTSKRNSFIFTPWPHFPCTQWRKSTTASGSEGLG